MRCRLFVMLVFISLFFLDTFSSVTENIQVMKILKEHGALTFSKKIPYGKGIESVYLGYDKQGQIKIGLAVKKTKTYKKVKTLVSIKPVEGGYEVVDTLVIDIEKLKKDYKDKVLEALLRIKGKVFSNPSKTKVLVDAVSGATKHYKAVSISYSLMISNLIKEFNQKPNWDKQQVK